MPEIKQAHLDKYNKKSVYAEHENKSPPKRKKTKKEMADKMHAKFVCATGKGTKREKNENHNRQ